MALPIKARAWQLKSDDISIDIVPGKIANSYEIIGCGKSGTVYKGDWHSQMVAVKRLHRVKEEIEDPEGDNFQRIKNEIAICLRLNHPRIVPFYGACIEDIQQPSFVTKYCEKGNVLDYVKHHPKVNKLELVRTSMLYEISLGMSYIHRNFIVHANLKASNILMGDDRKPLIGDFSMSQAKVKGQPDAIPQKNLSGIIYDAWTAPEIMSGGPLKYSADVYSFAITSWEIYTQDTPFSDFPEGPSKRRVVERHERPVCPSKTIPPSLKHLLELYWAPEPSERPRFVKIANQLKPLKSNGKYLRAY
ncbi:kinase-like domain-containing protein [Crucibulum laeve]|uniref:Kinase-like domain-containing protein n=1 Tax=Crucibulum laeve TaxID=68775 RepID=A0A5C3LQ78_9AGAR|nr:kinase-like domain-containing protein [Crucibulum laeve]